MKNKSIGPRALLRLALCGLLAALTPPTASRAETPVALDFGITPSHGGIWAETFSTMDDDAAGILRFPLDHPKAVSTALLGVGLLVLVDRPVTQFYQQHIERAFDGFSLPELPWEQPFRKLGLAREDVWLVSGIGASYAYGAVTGDERSRRAALLSSKAMLYSFVTTQVVLKTVTSRMRPCKDLSVADCSDSTFTNNPLDFGNYHGVSLSPDGFGTSMPSFHFTNYFAVARVYSGVYDDSWVPYGVAGLLSVSNIRGHNHWVSDMAAGALVGVAIGSVVLKNSDSYRAGHFTAVPYASPDSVGVTISTKF